MFSRKGSCGPPSDFRFPTSNLGLHPSAFRLPPSAFLLLPSYFCLPTSYFCLQTSAFRLTCYFPPFARPNIELQCLGQKTVENGRKTAKARPGETPAETGSSTGAPELRDLLNSCLLDLFDLVPSCQPIAAAPRGPRRGQRQQNAKRCRKMRMAATGQATISTHTASKPGPAAWPSSLPWLARQPMGGEREGWK